MIDRWDVIPDIHADVERLEVTLAALGPNARPAFLGDFIDAGRAARSSDDAAVLTRVRRLVEREGAPTVTGNHELNAILFHVGRGRGAASRAPQKNRVQHRSFLERFGAMTSEAVAWLEWFLTLPL